MASHASVHESDTNPRDLRALALALERAAEALHAAAQEAERTAISPSQPDVGSTPETRLLTVSQAAAILSLSRSKVYAHVLSGDIPSLTLGRSRRIPAAALAAWIKRQRPG